MNQLIKQLAESAFEPINDMASEGIADRHTFEQAWFQHYNQQFAEAIVFRIMERIDTEIGTALDHDEAYAAATLQALALTILDEFDMEVPGDDDWDAEAELQKIVDEFEQGSGI